MIRLKWLKVSLAGLLALSLTAGFIWLAVADEIGGVEVPLLASFGGASPEIVVSGNGQFVALTYYKQDTQNNRGAVYVKSATASDGWLTATFLGTGSSSHLAFRNGSNTIVYVVWASGDGKAIQTASCTLSTTVSPACVRGTDVETTTVDALDFPDIAVDTGGFIHVVWENNGTIKSARSSAANSVNGWSSPATVSGGGADGKPVLALSNSKLHLAFLRGATPTSVQYRRSNTGSHNWTDATAQFRLVNEVIGGSVHDKFDNPSIAASGNNVYMAWDAHRNSSNDFSLLQASSIDNGSSWGNAAYVPSGQSASLNPSGENKASSSGGLPVQETGLQPGLAISSTTAAIVWQQFPGDCSSDFTPSTIHFANPLVSASDTLSNTDLMYMVDADLAVAGGGVRHFVYMRDDNTDNNCSGGEATDYRITYRGPFTITTNDKGEGGGIYLPLIRK
jgi:hypothetical protein